jgi:hypothetical protein
LAETQGRPAVDVASEFTIAEPSAGKPTHVEQVYPTANVLPENQLKFYIYFSGPMSRGEAYARIHLIEASGKEIEQPFLELGEELWNREGTRFTLFFDPGRIKRGLKPREEVGPALEEGKRYTLEIDQAWTDAAGRSLSAPFRKEFDVAAPDDVQPRTAMWRLTAPAATTRDPLWVAFDEPLDRAMLDRVLLVQDATGTSLIGEVEVSEHEAHWAFRPERPWQAGSHKLVVDTALEDLAGNSLARPFEVDVFRSVPQTEEAEQHTIAFDVRAAGEAK